MSGETPKEHNENGGGLSDEEVSINAINWALQRQLAIIAIILGIFIEYTQILYMPYRSSIVFIIILLGVLLYSFKKFLGYQLTIWELRAHLPPSKWLPLDPKKITLVNFFLLKVNPEYSLKGNLNVRIYSRRTFVFIGLLASITIIYFLIFLLENPYWSIYK